MKPTILNLKADAGSRAFVEMAARLTAAGVNLEIMERAWVYTMFDGDDSGVRAPTCNTVTLTQTARDLGECVSMLKPRNYCIVAFVETKMKRLEQAAGGSDLSVLNAAVGGMRALIDDTLEDMAVLTPKGGVAGAVEYADDVGVRGGAGAIDVGDDSPTAAMAALSADCVDDDGDDDDNVVDKDKMSSAEHEEWLVFKLDEDEA